MYSHVVGLVELYILLDIAFLAVAVSLRSWQAAINLSSLSPLTPLSLPPRLLSLSLLSLSASLLSLCLSLSQCITALSLSPSLCLSLSASLLWLPGYGMLCFLVLLMLWWLISSESLEQVDTREVINGEFPCYFEILL